MDEKRPKPAFQISIMLALLLTALIAALIATWRVSQTSRSREMGIDFESNKRNAPLIQAGMTMKEVERIMGSSGLVYLNKWTYFLADDDKRRDSPKIDIVFENGRVKEVSRGRESIPSPYRYMPSP